MKNNTPQVEIQLWVVIGLAVSATLVSALGAFFSIEGLGRLFSGAVVAVWLMAGSLELAKFTVAAFLHQIWPRLNFFFKAYLLISVLLLSGITSVGIFGFLSDAYQESSIKLETETAKLDALKTDYARLEQDMDRLNKTVEEIPDSRITKKMRARAEIEPLIAEIRKKQETLNTQIGEASLKVLEVKGKVGPLIYIARVFGLDIDTTVKYLILAFVLVFDPLALCLVVALSMAIEIRREMKLRPRAVTPAPSAAAPPVPETLTPNADSVAPAPQQAAPVAAGETTPAALPTEPQAALTEPQAALAVDEPEAAPVEDPKMTIRISESDFNPEDLVEMRFEDEDSKKGKTGGGEAS